MSSSPPSHSRAVGAGLRLQALDGLRGLAALNVMLGHFLLLFWPQALHGNYPAALAAPAQSSPWLDLMRTPLLNIGFNGAFAVAVFFVLSGHVLMQHNGDMPPGASPSRLYLRRALARWPRLGLPVAAAVLGTHVLFLLGAMHPGALALLPGHGNGLDWFQVLAEALWGVLWLGWSRVDPPTWSLHWEFMGSVALLLAVALRGGSWPAGRHWRSAVAVALLLAALGWAAWRGNATYVLAMLAGAMRARAPHAPHQLRWLGLALAVYLGGFQYGHPWYGWSVLPGLGDGQSWQAKEWANLLGALLLVDAVRRGVGQRWLERMPLQWLGRWSFGLYLVHFALLLTLAPWLEEWLRPLGQPASIGLALAGYLAACLLVAAQFERWVDRPATALSRRLANALLRQATGHGSRALLALDYHGLLPLLARLPTPLAYRLGHWRSRWQRHARRDWAELTVGEPYVHARTLQTCAQLRELGCVVPASPLAAVQQRYDTVGREELDAYRLERHGWRCFETRTQALEQALRGRTPRRGLVVLSMHFDKSLVGVAGLGQLGVKTYAAASNLTEDLRIDASIRRYFQRKYAAANALMHGGGFVYIETGLRRLIKALRAGDAVCVFADAPAAEAQAGPGIWVPWLGQERRMQELALRLAHETDSDMLGLLCSHDDDNGATWHCTPVLAPAAHGDAQEDVRVRYLHIMAFLEAWVRRQPCRWWALHQLGDYPARQLSPAPAPAIQDTTHA